MSEVILYDYWRSSASYRVRLALELLGIAYRKVPVDLLKAEQRSPKHLARNPQGLVPVLDIDGVTGGFNFQAAWTTGWIAGHAMAGA